MRLGLWETPQRLSARALPQPPSTDERFSDRRYATDAKALPGIPREKSSRQRCEVLQDQ